MNIVHPSSMVNDIELTATIPIEMINAQQQLILWCDGKLQALKFESKELSEATEHAKKSKWKFSTLLSQYNRSLKKISYYEKIKAALLEGFYNSWLSLSPKEQQEYTAKIIHAVRNNEICFIAGNEIVELAEILGVFNNTVFMPDDCEAALLDLNNPIEQ